MCDILIQTRRHWPGEQGVPRDMTYRDGATKSLTRVDREKYPRNLTRAPLLMLDIVMITSCAKERARPAQQTRVSVSPSAAGANEPLAPSP